MNQLEIQDDNADLYSEEEQDFQYSHNFTPRITDVRIQLSTQQLTRLKKKTTQSSSEALAALW